MKPSVASDLLSIRDEPLGRGANFPASRGEEGTGRAIGSSSARGCARGDEQVPRVASGETRFHVRTRTLRRRRFVTASVPPAVV